MWLKDVRAGLFLARRAERRLRRSMNQLNWLIYRINHPVFREMFMAPRDIFRMRSGVVTLLAGNLQAGWRCAGPLLAFKSVFYAKSLANWLGAFRFGCRIKRGRVAATTATSMDGRLGQRVLIVPRKSPSIAGPSRGLHVPESRFGTWFTHTGAWSKHVLEHALGNLECLITDRRPSYPVIVDIGCGWGLSLKLLNDRFRPQQRLVAIDVDPRMIAAARAEALRHGLTVEFQNTTACHLGLQDRSVDMVFCHQTFHHVVDQEEALSEFHRVLKPGGVLLFAESTRKFIHSWIIRLLFRHPMNVQRTAAEYLLMIRRAGFAVAPGSLAFPYPWWSRPDLAIMERCFGVAPRIGHEQTLINLAAVRP
jgi:SAM-dependent methyltransferase